MHAPGGQVWLFKLFLVLLKWSILLQPFYDKAVHIPAFRGFIIISSNLFALCMTQFWAEYREGITKGYGLHKGAYGVEEPQVHNLGH